LNILITKRLEP